MNFPYGLVVRIRRSHRRGPGSIPGVGILNFFRTFFSLFFLFLYFFKTVKPWLSRCLLSRLFHYPDSHPIFSWILISHIFCQPLFSFKCDENAVELILFWTCVTFTCTITNTMHFTKLWLARICAIVEWNFMYSSNSKLCSLVLGSLMFTFSIIWTLNRPYSYSQYWTGTSLQWKLMRGNILKIIFIWKDFPTLASIAS